MNRHERQQAIAEARARAEALAAAYTARRGESAEADALAEAAEIHLRIGELRARLVDREESQARIAEFKAWGDEQQARIAELIKAELAKGATDFSTGPVREAIAHVTALTEVKRAEMRAWADERALRAWLDAEDELRTLDRPLPPVQVPSAGPQ